MKKMIFKFVAKGEIKRGTKHEHKFYNYTGWLS